MTLSAATSPSSGISPIAAFIEKWSPGGSNFGMSERAGAQPFFIDLCAVLGVATPDDPAHYSFERLTEKMGEARGWADVFKRRCTPEKLPRARPRVWQWQLPLPRAEIAQGH